MLCADTGAAVDCLVKVALLQPECVLLLSASLPTSPPPLPMSLRMDSHSTGSVGTEDTTHRWSSEDGRSVV